MRTQRQRNSSSIELAFFSWLFWRNKISLKTELSCKHRQTFVRQIVALRVSNASIKKALCAAFICMINCLKSYNSTVNFLITTCALMSYELFCIALFMAMLFSVFSLVNVTTKLRMDITSTSATFLNTTKSYQLHSGR